MSIYTSFAQMLTDAFVVTGNPYTIVEIRQAAIPTFPFAIIGRAERNYGLNVEAGHFEVELYEQYDSTLGSGDRFSNEASNRDAIENNYHALIQALQGLNPVGGYLITPTYSINGIGNTDVGLYGVTANSSEVQARVARFTVKYGLKD